MKALRIHAGPLARAHIARHGLQPADIGVIPAAAGGPKGLVLGPLDRFVFGHWLQGSTQPVHLVGASIGAWRMATACLDSPVAALERLERAYIHQHYAPPPGRQRPTAAQVSGQFGQGLRDFYAGQVGPLLAHPRWRLHIVASRGRHLLSRERRLATPLGYLGAFAANAVHRRALGWWLERVVLSGPAGEAPGAAMAALPFATSDYPTRQVALTEANFLPALQASCSIPFVLQAVHDIPGAPAGAYWDGGLTDYHLHLRYRPLADIEKMDAIKNIAICPSTDCAGGQKHSDPPGALVLYPHFQQSVVPGWLDKGLRWRHRATPALDRMVVLSPHPDWVRTLPNAKLPDRNDFLHYGSDLAARVRAWSAATSASRQLADEFAEWLRRPDPAVVLPL
ncbi:patatin-like phospholipase family protein [Acidovorax sp. NCPPB 3576]|uniref:patatin-like phospholipase family protein n=1 Tax=Acidovorax sp. NCPPB 3576 TaxID=2940488 RepID=UPI002349F58A|nr:patatin-like phospholipase family protein [Acidovorax sp. NCPPB 3576]WCM90828.1 patatin-like phospholipase family protein [Acidovorax sp. NCPPB 3576]